MWHAKHLPADEAAPTCHAFHDRAPETRRRIQLHSYIRLDDVETVGTELVGSTLRAEEHRCEVILVRPQLSVGRLPRPAGASIDEEGDSFHGHAFPS